MDAENFAKLTTILDLLDHYKKALSVALAQEAASQRRPALQLSRGLSRRSTRGAAGIFRYGSNTTTSPRPAFEEALERRKTLKRFQTLLSRRRTRLRSSFPSFSEPESSKSVSLSCLDEEMQERVASRGLLHLFTSRSTRLGEGGASADSSELKGDCPDFMSEPDIEAPPDVDWEVRSEVRRLSTHSLDNLTSEEMASMQPQVLSQLFDRILEYLQNDFEDLLEKLKEQAMYLFCCLFVLLLFLQNSHLKQDVLSLKKKLEDAVETNDEQVQELKEMTERISDLETEGRELSSQLSVLETRITRYQEQEKELLKLAEEKRLLDRECASLRERLQELSSQATSEDTRRASELAHDLISLRGSSQAKDEEIKSLKRELRRKERQLESFSVSLSTQQLQPSLESPRGDLTSRQQTPRSSAGHLFSGLSPNPRRVSVKHLLTAPPPPPVQRQSVSLASELQLSSDDSLPRGLLEVTEKLKAALREVESLRESNQELRKQLLEIRAELDAKEAAAARALEEKAAELAAARMQMKKETAEALEATQEELRLSAAALCLTAADNDRLLAEVEEGRRLLQAAKEEQAAAMAAGSSAAVISELEKTVSALQQSLDEKTARLTEAEERGKELARQRESLHAEVESNQRQIEELAARVQTLETQLAATADVAAAFEEEIAKLKEFIESSGGSSEEREEAERQRAALLELLERERDRVASLAAAVSQQRSLHAEQQLLQLHASQLQQELQQQQAFLMGQLQQQEEEGAAVRGELERKLQRAEEEKQRTQAELQAAYGELQQMQIRMQALTEERRELEQQAAELAGVSRHRDALLQQREAELREVQQQLQTELDRVEELVKKETAAQAEIGQLQQDLAALESGLHAEREEKEKLLMLMQQEIKQAEQAQQAALAAMQQQMQELQQGREALLLEGCLQSQEQKRMQEQQELLQQEVCRLREKNEALEVELQQLHGLHAGEAQQLEEQQRQLLQQLQQTQEKYALLQQELDSSSKEYQQMLQDAHSQLAELKPRTARMAEEHRKKEEDLLQQLQQVERMRLLLQQEVAELRKQNEAALQQQTIQPCGPSEEEAELLLANARIRQENEELRAEVAELKALVASGHASELASVLQEVKEQLEHLSVDFLAFKAEEQQEMHALKSSRGGPTHVFNVSYPPAVIPLISVHESRQGKDKTVNISGVLDLRTAAGLSAAGFRSKQQQQPAAAAATAVACQRSCLQDWLCSLQSRCCSGSDSRAVSAKLQEDKWHSKTHVFQPERPELSNGLRVHVGGDDPAGSLRVERSFLLPEEGAAQPAS
ncbi:hypothetical protein Efla_003219 [Eimeria flavescens]